MSTNSNQRLQDAAILTRGVERVLRKLIRFLVGKISLVKLQEMIRFIYVEESERKLRMEKPGKDIPLTQLALLTGLDTRTLAKTRNDSQYRKPHYQMERFVKSMTPESCVLDVWISKPEYLDPLSNKPRQLQLVGDGPSFERLIRESVSSRGVTVQSMLSSLVRNRAVDFDEESQTVTLLEKIVAPFKADDPWGTLEVGLLHVCSLLETVFHNHEAVKVGSLTHYQRGCWTHRLNIKDRLDFEKALRTFLKSADDEARNIMDCYEEKVQSENQITAGVSMFYFEEEFIGVG